MAADDAASDAARIAAAEGLRYVSDDRPGIRRRRARHGFVYYDPSGRRITERDELKRIASLAVPPAYTEVWICPNPKGHLQATGRDARGRKQYRYHPRWRSVRDEHKYDRLIAFGRAIPAIRRRTARDLALPGMPRQKVVATAVRLLESTMMRVGNEQYAKTNGSYGLTTLRDRHVTVTRGQIRISYKGKHGIRQSAVVSDARLAAIVRRCRDLPGQELFQYVDERGEQRVLDSADVNEYLREASGGDFTAKDFRTWFGTLAAMECLEACADAIRPEDRRRALLNAIEQAAQRLGNTPAMCRKCYVHPVVINAFLAGSMAPGSSRARNPERRLLAMLEAAAADPTGIEAWAKSLAQLRARQATTVKGRKRNTKARRREEDRRKESWLDESPRPSAR